MGRRKYFCWMLNHALKKVFKSHYSAAYDIMWVSSLVQSLCFNLTPRIVASAVCCILMLFGQSFVLFTKRDSLPWLFRPDSESCAVSLFWCILVHFSLLFGELLCILVLNPMAVWCINCIFLPIVWHNFVLVGLVQNSGTRPISSGCVYT